MSIPVEGWYQDPEDPTQLRWWDGVAWTDHTHVAPTAAPTAPVTTPAVVPDEGADQFDDLEIDLEELQPDHSQPTIGGAGGAKVADVVDRPSPAFTRVLAATILAVAAAMVSALGTGLVLGLALASGSPSHSVTQTLFHAEQGVILPVAVAAVVAVVLDETILYSLRWGLERVVGVQATVRGLRPLVLATLLGTSIGVAILVVLGISAPIAVMVGTIALICQISLQLQRSLG